MRKKWICGLTGGDGVGYSGCSVYLVEVQELLVMAKRLTEKQQKFAELVASGETNIAAWEKAGYTMNMKRDTLISKAAALGKKPWIADEVKRLRPPKPLPKFSHIANPKEIMAMYTKIIRDPTATAKEKMEAAEKLAKLQGLHGNVVDEERSKEWMHLMPGSYEFGCMVNMALQAKMEKRRKEQLAIVEQD